MYAWMDERLHLLPELYLLLKVILCSLLLDLLAVLGN